MKATDLFEMPISNIHHVGDFSKNSSFRDQDRKLLTNPKAIQKIKAMWRYPEETLYNVILVNHPDGGKWTEVGEVTHDWLETNMPRIWDQLEPLLNHDQLNIIYTNNKGDERVPMTGWILAHRLGHALTAQRTGKPNYYMQEAYETFSRYAKDALEHYGIAFVESKRFYDWPRTGPSLGFFREICTFRAARENNIRNPAEIPLELLAQYMITGRIKFNVPPRGFRYGRNHYGYRGSQQDYENFAHGSFCRDLSYEMESLLSTAVGYADGRIFVM